MALAMRSAPGDDITTRDAAVAQPIRYGQQRAPQVDTGGFEALAAMEGAALVTEQFLQNLFDERDLAESVRK